MNKGSVLLVEDELKLVEVLRANFEHQGFSVVSVGMDLVQSNTSKEHRLISFYLI